MTDTTGRSPFDLEDDPVGATPADAPPEVAAAPAPVRARPERSTRTRARREAAPAAPGEQTGGGFARFVEGFFTGPRWFYALTSVMSAVLLFVLYNPEFGLQARVWFWEALQGKGPAYPYAWNPTLLQAAALPLLSLAFAAAALSGDRRGRSLWGAFWVLMAFVTFQVARDELRYFLPPIVAAAGVGFLIRHGRGERATQGIWIVVIVLAAFLFLPLPESKAGIGSTDLGGTGYRCAAIGLVDLMIDAPGPPEDGALTRRAKLLLLEVPQYVTLLVFVLLLMAGVGIRGRWLGHTGGALLLIFLIAFSWLQYDLGSAQMDVETVGGPDWWNGARQIGDAWRARLLVFLPALAAVMAECRLGRRSEASE
ncbi:MAG: hypothetical protein QNJ98_14235 [Planctomycetota bacterium]|nr:hypothetical protein [Planctomycetota bacterium]